VKTLGGAILLIVAGTGLLIVQTQTPSAAAMDKGMSVSQVVQQLEHQWVDAARAGNTDKLNTILADDWVGLGFGADKSTKQSYLADVKAGSSKIESFEFGPMDVKVMGNVAVVQGSDNEKSSYKGQDTSGKWVWMDVFEKHGDKWLVVRSQTSPVK
jgi:ketosteroid isomerase-like protein